MSEGSIKGFLEELGKYFEDLDLKAEISEGEGYRRLDLFLKLPKKMGGSRRILTVLAPEGDEIPNLEEDRIPTFILLEDYPKKEIQGASILRIEDLEEILEKKKRKARRREGARRRSRVPREFEEVELSKIYSEIAELTGKSYSEVARMVIDEKKRRKSRSLKEVALEILNSLKRSNESTD